MSRQSSSCLGRALKILGYVLLGVGVLYFLATINLRSLGLPIGKWPRMPLYVYTTSKVTMTFDGQQITIEGTTRCKRRFELNEDGDLWLPIIMHVGFAYHCGPEWFAHRFKDGSALLVGAYSNSSTWRRALSGFLRGLPAQPNFDGDFMSAQLSRVPAAVIWLDNAETPTRAEYYYSMATLEDPRSRLTAIQHEAEMWPASLWTSLFTGRSATDPSKQIPWTGNYIPVDRFIGHYAAEIPEEEWRTVDGLRESFSKISKPTLLRPSEHLTRAQLKMLLSLLPPAHQRVLPRHVRVAAAGLSKSTIGEGAASDGRELRDVVARAIRPAGPESSNFRVFRFEHELPNGALRLSRRDSERLGGPIELHFGNEIVGGTYGEIWNSGLLFDPSSNIVYHLRIMTF